MDYQPIFRECRLSLANDEDMSFAVDILAGKVSISLVAESLGQEFWSFDGDGDILVLSYSRDVDESSASKEAAERILGQEVQSIVRSKLVPAIVDSTEAIELVVRCCNLDMDSIIAVARALQSNCAFIGFNVQGNPGNDEAGTTALRSACLETMAPLKWFQGKVIDSSMYEARQELARKRTRTTIENDSLSPRTKVAELCRIQKARPGEYCESAEDFFLKRTDKGPRHTARPEDNDERHRWSIEMRNKLRKSHAYTALELDDIVMNLELLRLQDEIDHLLTKPQLEMHKSRPDKSVLPHLLPLIA